MGMRIINEPELPENVLKNMPSARLIRIKIRPPKNSYFQAITRAMINTKAGMLCITNPRICLPKDSFPPKTSRENIIIKSIERIARTLGNQYRILSIIADII